MFKKKLNKFFIYSFVSFVVSAFIVSIYIFLPNLLDSFDNRVRDSYFLYRGEIPTSQTTVIIDIDEKALSHFGQWPWSRDILSKIVKNLTEANIAVIGMDIVFAEEDRTSPINIAKKLKINQELEDYDLEYANTIANSPVILGYSFDLSNKQIGTKKAPAIPAIFIEKGKQEHTDYILKASAATLNLPIIQDNAYSSGFFNVVPDASGVIRSVPLLISYDDILYPSLSLEIVRALNDTKKVFVNYDDSGVANIVLDNIVIPTDRFGRLFVNYRGGERTFKYFSAKDIYDNNFDIEEIEGKIALFGTSAVGLFDLRSTPFESVFPGVEVHANLIDNILTEDFIQKASYLDGVNILIVIALSFLSVMLITFTPFYLKPFMFLSLVGAYIFASYHLLFESGIVLNIIFPLTTIFLASISALLFDYFYNIKNANAIKQKFATKVSKSVMDDILNHIDDDKFSVKNKEVTIFFSDIRGFTQISEQLTAKELILFLNRYMEPMSKIIIDFQGTIDKL